MGNNLTTEVTQGALASTQSHTDMQEELGKSDRQTYAALLNDQLIRAWREVTVNDNFEGEILFKTVLQRLMTSSIYYPISH